MDKIKSFFAQLGKDIKGFFVKGEKEHCGFISWLFGDSGKSVISALICIVIGLVIGSVVIFALNAQNAFTAIVQVLKGGLNHFIPMRGMGKVVSDSVPLILCGLAILFAYKCGMFNIGAAGQYTVGAFFVHYVALMYQWPWYLCLIAGVLGGMLWGVIPGLFKAFLQVNEVITSIMFNWIALYVVNGIMIADTVNLYNILTAKAYTISTVSPGSILPSGGLSALFGDYGYICIGVYIAIFAAIAVSIVLNKTKFGYEIKSTGFNANAAKYAGMNHKKNIIMTMAISGGLAGLGAACYYLSGVAVWNPNVSTTLPAVGFNGIAAAFLGGLNPIATIFSSIFITHITVGGSYLDNTYYSPEVSSLICSVIIYVCAFSLFIKTVLDKKIKLKGGKDNNANAQVQEVLEVEETADVSEQEKESEGGDN